ncbi:hypothetical protein [uncultured Mediterranean phage uvMED]|nr:hypothetical protein [uncultured Mediterranean phage uvMED]
MSKSTELDKKAKLYLLDAMRSYLEDDYSIDSFNNNEIIDFIKSSFYSTNQWSIDRYGRQKSLTDWLQGLALPIDFYYCDIIQLAKDWGSIPQNATEKQESKICDNYWSFMANKLGQLFDGYRVPKEISA